MIDGPNLYAYCNNDPVNTLDLYGLFGKEAFKEIIVKGEYIFKIFKGDTMHGGEHIHVYLRKTGELLARISPKGKILTGNVSKTELKSMKKAGLIGLGAGVMLGVMEGKGYTAIAGDIIQGFIDPTGALVVEVGDDSIYSETKAKK